jgi:TolB-like protein/DNA-binding winged helix-turn-helix (wHTH) protein
MTNGQNNVLRVGAWRVDTTSGDMSKDGNTIKLEARTVRLLSYMASRAGEVVSIDDLLDNVWTGVVVTQDSVYQAVASLRRALGDDTKEPRYIVTVPRFGYRLIADVEFGEQPDVSSIAVPIVEPIINNANDDNGRVDQTQPVFGGPARPRRAPWRAAIAAAIALVIVSSVVWVRATGKADQTDATVTPVVAKAVAEVHTVRSIAVLPFLDLTDDMKEEPFADGMSEEVIGKLSKLPGLAVSPPTSSFYFKDKQVTIAEVSKALHAEYVLDGSVRKSGKTLRVAARLTRAQDGFIIWSENYDRDWSDKLMIQDDIAQEVAKALATSIH